MDFISLSILISTSLGYELETVSWERQVGIFKEANDAVQWMKKKTLNSVDVWRLLIYIPALFSSGILPIQSDLKLARDFEIETAQPSLVFCFLMFVSNRRNGGLIFIFNVN